MTETKNRFRAACIVGAATLFACTASAQAAPQQSYDHWSLEAMATQARAVFRGHVRQVDKIEYDPKPPKPQRSRDTLTIGVAERVKGNTDSWMTLDRETIVADTRFDVWQKDQSQLLWFRFSEDDPRPFPTSLIGPGLKLPPGQSWSAVHLAVLDPAEKTSDANATDSDFSMDLSLVPATGDKVGIVKKFLKETPDKAKLIRLQIPLSMVTPMGYTSGVHFIVVPVTPQLEATAMKMIDTPDFCLPKDHSAADATIIKASGVKALTGFKSDKNVALLKGLLNDPGRGPSTATESSVKTLYWVRLSAYNTLTGWGVAVAKPTL